MSQVTDASQERVDDPEVEYVRRQFKLLMYRLRQLPEGIRARLQGHLTQSLLEDVVKVDTPRGAVSFVTLGRLGGGRGMNMLTKQRRRSNGSTGSGRAACSGTSAPTSASSRCTRPCAAILASSLSSPRPSTSSCWAANCEANHVEDRVQRTPGGLGQTLAFGTLEISQFAAAQSFSLRGKKKKKAYASRQGAFIASMDELVDTSGLPCPNYIKIDVPGLTHDIVAGAERTLARPDVRELHIEMSEESDKGKRIVEQLTGAGLLLAQRDSRGTTDLTFVRAGA
jgi:hypothetical protein